MTKKDLSKHPLGRFSFWAKRSDNVSHIVDNDSKQVGGGVLCGKYGALLGNNYQDDLPELCEECLSKLNIKK